MSRVTTLLTLLTAVLLGGCGGETDDKWTKDRKAVVPVSGLVTYKGSPLPGATVTLHSTQHQIAASGLTDKDGRFVLKTYEEGDGAAPGEAVITVEKKEIQTTPHPTDPNLGPIDSKEIWHTPKAYSQTQTSPLKATIPDKGTDSLVLDLKD